MHYHVVNYSIGRNCLLAASVLALRPFFQWLMGFISRFFFSSSTPSPLADSWLNAGSIIRLQRDGTLPLRFRCESFEFRLPIKLKCNFPSFLPLFPLSRHRQRLSMFLSAISFRHRLYLSRIKSRTFGAISSEVLRRYDAYISFIARKETRSCPWLDEVNQRTFNCQMKRLLLQNDEKINGRIEIKKTVSILSLFFLSSLTLLFNLNFSLWIHMSRSIFFANSFFNLLEL